MPLTLALPLNPTDCPVTSLVLGRVGGIRGAACAAAGVAPPPPPPKDAKDTPAPVSVPVLTGIAGVPCLSGDVAVAQYLAEVVLSVVPASSSPEATQWVELAIALLTLGAAPPATLASVDAALESRTFLVGYGLTFSDLVLYAAMARVTSGSVDDRWVHLKRWMATVVPPSSPVGGASSGGAGGAGGAKKPKLSKAEKKALNKAKKKADKEAAKASGGAGAGAGAAKSKKPKKGQDPMADLPALPLAKEGEVLTRFPPEPSGYLHIGHAKALMVNDGYARKYKGKLLVRFDDTNPSKENAEFVDAILADLKRLGIRPDFTSHTSDHFDLIIEYARKLILDGKAYMDDTPVEKMREMRKAGETSPYASTTAAVNMERFDALLAGDADSWCLRANIGNMKISNTTMRDPVLFRSNKTPHVRTGTKYKAYPTYDLACPIVDSVEGVTHALRTTEYTARNAQYDWLLEAMSLRKVHIVDFSRLNFVYTLMSKRKLQWFVDEGRVDGWSDPRFPTIQGMLRRGLQVSSLRKFMLSQGASRRVLDMEWDKFWVMNRREIDPIAKRFIAISRDSRCRVKLVGGDGVPSGIDIRAQPVFPKVDAGPGKQKMVMYTDTLWIEQDDADLCELNEEITLRAWGNCIVKALKKDDTGRVVEMEAVLNVGGDFTKTKKKVTWVADTDQLVDVEMHEFDFLITKRKLLETDRFEDCINPTSEAVTHAVGHSALRNLNEGDIIQLERRGFYRVDKPTGGAGQPVVLFMVPDGKQKAMSTLSTKLAHR